MTCDYCGKDGAKLRYKTQVYGPKNDKFLVDKVPVVRCPHGHQSYMAAQTAKALDRLLQQRKELARPQTLDVIEFAQFRVPNQTLCRRRAAAPTGDGCT